MTYIDESKMPFGKYQGQKLADIPASYLLWAFYNIKKLDLGLKIYIRENMPALLKELGTNG
jgi:uncharacterized protein (DUF3820 family)